MILAVAETTIGSNALRQLALGTAAMFVGALIANLLPAGSRSPSPGWSAWRGWAPIAVAVLVARVMHQPQVALGIVFGTSVAILSSVIGALGVVAPIGQAPNAYRRVQPFALSATLIAFLVGFTGYFTWVGIVALLVQGMVVLQLWAECAREMRQQGSVESIVSAMQRRQDASLPVMLAVLAIALAGAGVGAFFATRAAVTVAGTHGGLPLGATAATALSIAVALPLMKNSGRYAAGGSSWAPMTTYVGVLLLNLCVLLPILALAPYAHWLLKVRWAAGHVVYPEFAPTPLAFPLAVWRIDALIMVVLSVLLLPVSAGKWKLAAGEGAVMILGYCLYVITVVWTSAMAG